MVNRVVWRFSRGLLGRMLGWGGLRGFAAESESPNRTIPGWKCPVLPFCDPTHKSEIPTEGQGRYLRATRSDLGVFGGALQQFARALRLSCRKARRAYSLASLGLRIGLRPSLGGGSGGCPRIAHRESPTGSENGGWTTPVTADPDPEGEGSRRRRSPASETLATSRALEVP